LKTVFDFSSLFIDLPSGKRRKKKNIKILIFFLTEKKKSRKLVILFANYFCKTEIVLLHAERI